MWAQGSCWKMAPLVFWSHRHTTRYSTGLWWIKIKVKVNIQWHIGVSLACCSVGQVRITIKWTVSCALMLKAHAVCWMLQTNCRGWQEFIASVSRVQHFTLKAVVVAQEYADFFLSSWPIMSLHYQNGLLVSKHRSATVIASVWQLCFLCISEALQSEFPLKII